MKAHFGTLGCLAYLAHFLSGNAAAQDPAQMDSMIRRSLVSQGDTSRLKAVFEKARRGEALTVAAVGGSITAGGVQTQDPKNRYIQQVAQWFEVNFPGTKINFINAGIGGTNSYYGAMRLQADVLAKNPDLVIVEWAVNNDAGREIAESYEGALRQLLSAPRNVAVIELFFMHKDGANAQMWQEILGRHYQLPMVSFRDALWPEFISGRTKWEDYYADVVHPKDAGHLLVSKFLTKFLDSALQDKESSLAPTALPAPAISDLYAHCQFSSNEKLNISAQSGWERSADQKFWIGSEAGSWIEFTFTGQSLFVGYDFDKEQPPQAVFSIDGGEAQPLKEDAHRRPIATALSKGQHRIRIEVQRKGELVASPGKLKIWGVGGAESEAAVVATP